MVSLHRPLDCACHPPATDTTFILKLSQRNGPRGRRRQAIRYLGHPKDQVGTKRALRDWLRTTCHPVVSLSGFSLHRNSRKCQEAIGPSVSFKLRVIHEDYEDRVQAPCGACSWPLWPLMVPIPRHLLCAAVRNLFLSKEPGCAV